jgi:hypothetical protein
VTEEALKLGERLLKLLSWPANGITDVFVPPYQTNQEIKQRIETDEQQK